MFWIVLGAWLAGVVVSLIYGNRKMPLIILAIGIAAIAAQYTIGIGYALIVILAILSIIIWIANKLEMM